ncbi:copper resistance CopC/CopD family protein [Virgibacillus flavescens]|uniref:copper resistance CopC/CopD family protein n=1 Tax=Virgibacillus flavescens TaxID=1611422 RepID=UPI003D33E72F
MKTIQTIIHIAIIFILVLTFTQPLPVEAHTSLTEATPASGSKLEKSPQEVRLTFSSKIAPNLSTASINIQNGEPVKDTTEAISEDQKSILLKLPDLESGNYTVDYKVVSVDGHPVEGTYNFTLNLPAPVKKEIETSKKDMEHSEAQKNSIVEKDENKKNSSTQPSTNEVKEAQHTHETSTYLIRLIYFFSILALAGWVLWGALSSILSSEVKSSYLKGSKILQFLLLLSLVGYGYLQFNILVTGLDEFQSLVFQTPFGIGWLTMFVLSLAGFFIIHRSKIIDIIWVISLLFGEVLIGHAIAQEPLLPTVILDWIHLIAAAIWVGGLTLLVIFWKNHRSFITEFLPSFSRYALLSVITLTITGSLMTILFLPDLSLLYETLWGKILLLKISMVLLLVIIGFSIRKTMKNRQASKLKNFVEWDFGIMVGIVLLVSILTIISPDNNSIENPENEIPASETQIGNE